MMPQDDITTAQVEADWTTTYPELFDLLRVANETGDEDLKKRIEDLVKELQR